jgi:hypothetical protein
LHVFQAALTAFRASLSRLDRPTATPGDAHEPLREWLLCQAALDALPGIPGGEPHVVRLSVLRREMEERLREEMWSIGGVLECTAELDQACAAYLTFADRHLRRALDAARREEERRAAVRAGALYVALALAWAPAFQAAAALLARGLQQVLPVPEGTLLSPAISGTRAAAVLLTRRDLLPAKFPHPLVRVAGGAIATDTLALHDRPDILDFRAARLSVERACAQAGISPQEADFFEVYDYTSVAAALSLEAAGFAERGQGWRLAQGDWLTLRGRLPISTFGGLKARGNPGGAAGLYQIVEAALQLRGEAGPNQVREARWGLTQALGGAASTAVTHVLALEE